MFECRERLAAAHHACMTRSSSSALHCLQHSQGCVPSNLRAASRAMPLCAAAGSQLPSAVRQQSARPQALQLRPPAFSSARRSSLAQQRQQPGVSRVAASSAGPSTSSPSRCVWSKRIARQLQEQPWCHRPRDPRRSPRSLAVQHGRTDHQVGDRPGRPGRHGPGEPAAGAAAAAACWAAAAWVVTSDGGRHPLRRTLCTCHAPSCCAAEPGPERG